MPWVEWSKLLVIWKVLFNTFLSLSQEYSELTCSGEDWQRDKGALSSELIHSKFNDKYPKIPIFDTIEEVGNNSMSEYCSGDLSIELFSLNIFDIIKYDIYCINESLLSPSGGKWFIVKFEAFESNALSGTGKRELSSIEDAISGSCLSASTIKIK